MLLLLRAPLAVPRSAHPSHVHARRLRRQPASVLSSRADSRDTLRRRNIRCGRNVTAPFGVDGTPPRALRLPSAYAGFVCLNPPSDNRAKSVTYLVLPYTVSAGCDAPVPLSSVKDRL